MATPPNKSLANTNATTALNILLAAADQLFIDNAATAILEAISQGKYLVTLNTFENCDLRVLHDYFVGLGYAVSYPGLNMYPGAQPFQPMELFGIFWIQFWENWPFTPVIINPARVTLSWK